MLRSLCKAILRRLENEDRVRPVFNKSICVSTGGETENENGTGIIKAVFDKKKKTMIGAVIAGGPACELITICSIMIDNELPVERMKSYVFPHPTCAEAIREAIFAAKL